MPKTYPSRNCQNTTCQKPFTPKSKFQKFCSGTCRFEQWERDNPRIKKVHIQSEALKQEEDNK